MDSPKVKIFQKCLFAFELQADKDNILCPVNKYSLRVFVFIIMDQSTKADHKRLGFVKGTKKKHSKVLDARPGPCFSLAAQTLLATELRRS